MSRYPGSPEELAAELRPIVDYLLWARDAEIEPWFRDDYQIALRTCLNLGKGVPRPFAVACRETLGLHPDKVWPAIVERKRWLLKGAFREGVDDVTWHPHAELVAAWEARQNVSENVSESVRGTSPKKPCRRVEFLPRRVA